MLFEGVPIPEVLRQFERWKESGWSKSEVPSSACLEIVIVELGTLQALLRENAILTEVICNLTNNKEDN